MRGNFIPFLSCLLLAMVILSSTVLSGQPTPPYSLSVDMVAQNDLGTEGEFRVVLRLFDAKLLECQEAVMCLHYTGSAVVAGQVTRSIQLVDREGPESKNPAIPDRSVYDTIVSVTVADNDTCHFSVEFDACGRKFNSGRIFLVSSSDTLQVFKGPLPAVWKGDTMYQWHDGVLKQWVQPEGTVQAFHPSDLHGDTAIYTIDLTDRKRFDEFKSIEAEISPDRPMDAPGIYDIRITQRRYKAALREGYRVWPKGEPAFDDVPIDD